MIFDTVSLRYTPPMTLRQTSLLLLPFLAPALAIAGDMPSSNEALPRPATLSVIEGWRAEDGTHTGAIRITLDPEWKTYWRAPGDAGIPPEFDFSGSTNWGALTFHWPVPHVFETNGMATIGYGGDVILPFTLRPETDGPAQLEADVLMGVCRDICMPFEDVLSAELPSRPYEAARDEVISAALGRTPQSRDEAGVAHVACMAAPIADGMRLTATVTMQALGPIEHVAFELLHGAGGEPATPVWFSEAVSTREGEVLVSFADAVPPEAAPFEVDFDGLRLTVLAGDQAVDIQGCDTHQTGG